jgi:hypothetical protein
MLGEGLKYTSEPFYLPGSAVPERFVCRFPTVAERDAYHEAINAGRDKDGVIMGVAFARAVLPNLAPLVERHVVGDESNAVTVQEVLNAVPYHEVLVAIATTIFRGASFNSAAGTAEDS